MPTPVRCRIVRIEGSGLVPTATAGPSDELVLLIAVPAGTAARRLRIDIVRGDDCRDTRLESIDAFAGPVVLACRLHWRDRPGASTRLSCRVFLDGTPAASAAVLLLPRQADAQGRLNAAPPVPMSGPTQMAIVREFELLVDQSSENRNGRPRTSR